MVSDETFNCKIAIVMTWHFQTNHKKFQDSRSSYTHSITIYTYMYVRKGTLILGPLFVVCTYSLLHWRKLVGHYRGICHLPQMVPLCELIWEKGQLWANCEFLALSKLHHTSITTQKLQEPYRLLAWLINRSGLPLNKSNVGKSC